MSTFRASFPQTPEDAASVLERITRLGGKPVVVGGGTLTVPALVRGELLPTDVVDLGRTGLDPSPNSALLPLPPSSRSFPVPPKSRSFPSPPSI